MTRKNQREVKLLSNVTAPSSSLSYSLSFETSTAHRGISCSVEMGISAHKCISAGEWTCEGGWAGLFQSIPSQCQLSQCCKNTYTVVQCSYHVCTHASPSTLQEREQLSSQITHEKDCNKQLASKITLHFREAENQSHRRPLVQSITWFDISFGRKGQRWSLTSRQKTQRWMGTKAKYQPLCRFREEQQTWLKDSENWFLGRERELNMYNCLAIPRGAYLTCYKYLMEE